MDRFREVNAAHQFYSVLKRSGVQCEMAKVSFCGLSSDAIQADQAGGLHYSP